MPDDMLATLPARKRLNHRGPLSIDVSSAWYFITICADERFDYGRAVSMKPPSTPFIEHATEILDAARFRHCRAAWRLALFLIMPDHIHLIAHFPSVSSDAAVSSKPPYHGGMRYVIADLKRWLSTKYGIRFQRDFFDTRLRDDTHFAEKYNYILGNPVRKGLCATTEEWPYSIAFSRIDGRAVSMKPPGCVGRAVSMKPPECGGRAVSMKPPNCGDDGGIVDAALPDAALPDAALPEVKR